MCSENLFLLKGWQMAIFLRGVIVIVAHKITIHQFSSNLAHDLKSSKCKMYKYAVFINSIHSQ